MGSPDREPASVILPTIEWGRACDQMADQITPEDELLIVCDSESDPVASEDPPQDNVHVLVAGEPEGCSGKANAVAYAMERAENDRFVWTDDDFGRDPDWLDELIGASEREGTPATAVPIYVGGGWWNLIEPLAILTASVSIYYEVGVWAGDPWGGGVTFTRDDLDVDEFVSELRQSLSDDGLLANHLVYTYPVRSLVHRIPAEEDFDGVKNRLIRLNRLAHVHEGMAPLLVITLLVAAVAVLFPIPVAAVSTALMAAVYWGLGFRSWTFLLAFPSLFLYPISTASGILFKEFEWGGRTYRLNGVFDVDVVSETDPPESPAD